MKRIIKIVILITFPLTLLSQRKQTIIYWIPEKYINSLVLNGTKNEYKNYLKPIEAIANENGKWLIGTYRGMFQPLILSNKFNAQKIPIKELSLNLNVFTKEEQDSINQIKYFIKTYTDSLILEAYSGINLLETKKYIKAFKGYKFEYLGKTERVLLLQGRYDIYNSNGEKIESEIEISPNGYVNGSYELHSYDLKRVSIPDEHNNFYDLIEFHLKDKTIKKLAIKYNEKEKKWIGYDYQIKNDKYIIHVLPKLIFHMQKI